MKRSLAIIGGGNMGSAILKSIRNKYKVSVCEKDHIRCAYLRQAFAVPIRNLPELSSSSEIILLSVKPQDFESILKEMRGTVNSEQLVISIAAGITTGYIEKRLGKRIRVIRAMPNLPAQIQEGITAICRGRYAQKKDVDQAQEIFDCLGTTLLIEEKRMDAITAISGSGPAYVFLFVECMVKAARLLGFDGPRAQTLVRKTLLGSMHLLERQAEDAAALRAKVTSKGGTTQAAMDIFFKNHLDKIFIEAIQAARKRAKELSQ